MLGRSKTAEVPGRTCLLRLILKVLPAETRLQYPHMSVKLWLFPAEVARQMQTASLQKGA